MATRFEVRDVEQDDINGGSRFKVADFHLDVNDTEENQGIKTSNPLSV